MMVTKKEIKVAIIDMNDGFPNLGIQGIITILSLYEKEHGVKLSTAIFDLRKQNEIPGINHDIYISSGGPGNPLDGESRPWEQSFSQLLDNIEAYNTAHADKKHVFLICYSFQLACRKYGVGKITKRNSGVFGIFPVTLTAEGENDIIYKNLANPFYVIDSRDWQVIDPEGNPFTKQGAQVLAMEKDRPAIDLERCIMSVRFSKEFVGTQFHPEADPADVKSYLLDQENKEAVILSHGKDKYEAILHHLDNPNGITRTQKNVLPNFITQAIQSLSN